jgi:hypothetical protein
MTGTEASERDEGQQEKIAAQKAQLAALDTASLPPASAFLETGWTAAPHLEEPVEEAVEEVEEAENAEEAIIDPLLPPSTAPAAIQVSRAGRKRVPTMKALEAEKPPKRGIE